MTATVPVRWRARTDRSSTVHKARATPGTRSRNGKRGHLLQVAEQRTLLRGPQLRGHVFDIPDVGVTNDAGCDEPAVRRPELDGDCDIDMTVGHAPLLSIAVGMYLGLFGAVPATEATANAVNAGFAGDAAIRFRARVIWAATGLCIAARCRPARSAPMANRCAAGRERIGAPYRCATAGQSGGYHPCVTSRLGPSALVAMA